MPRGLLDRLREDGVLAKGFSAEPSSAQPEPGRGPPHLALLQLCNQRALDGGLTVALDVRPDELIGPLCTAVGGTARKLRVLDVRERPSFELRIAYGDLEEPWEVEDLYALVHNLNDLLKDDRTARAIAVLGEWEDALQLWCVKKEWLPRLFRRDYFAPRNRAELSPRDE